MSNLTHGADLLASILTDDDTDAQYTPTATTVLKFEVKKFVLQALLEKAITVVPIRDVMPVLKCFLFDVAPQRLRVIATDMELSMIATTSLVSVSQPGTAVFPAKRLLEIVKSADAGDVSIKVSGYTAHITIGRASWSLKLQGGEDYPAMPAISEVAFIAIERAVFASAILAVRYAASRDPNRASLNIIDIKDGKLTACDGSRIQQARVSDFPIDLRIPIGAVDDLLRLLKITDLDTVHVGQSDNHLIFRFGGDVFIVNKFVAQFPDMEQSLLAPALSNKHGLDVDRTELLAAIKRVRINADANSSAIALTLTPSNPATVTVSARDNVGNTASESIEAAWAGPSRIVVVNHVFLTDMINTYGDATCTFRLGDDTKTRRSPLMLRHQKTGSVGVVQQMNSDWVGL